MNIERWSLEHWEDRVVDGITDTMIELVPASDYDAAQARIAQLKALLTRAQCYVIAGGQHNLAEQIDTLLDGLGQETGTDA